MVETFYDTIKESNSPTGSTKYVSIPSNLIKGLGWKKGDRVKVLILKVDMAEEKQRYKVSKFENENSVEDEQE